MNTDNAIPFALLFVLGACNAAGPDGSAVRLGELDQLFQLERSVVLEEPDDHPIGLAADASVTEAGRVYLVDFHSKAVRSYDSDGRLDTVFGRVGEGPGEYTVPVSVAARGATVSVADIGLIRISDYWADGGGFAGIQTSYPERPVRFIRYGPDGQLVVASKPSYEEMELYDGTGPAFLASVDSVAFLPLPESMAGSTITRGLINGLVAAGDKHIVAAITGHPTVYRYDYRATVQDSIVLGPDLYTPVRLPPTVQGYNSSEFARQYKWIQALAATKDGETAILEFHVYSAEADEWLQQVVWIPFGSELPIAVTDPCDCKLVGVVGEQLVLLRGEAPLERRIEYWTRREG